ncbi:ketopantoate reductase family protein [Sporosarcina koreensis]|uniref:2-dehydropantoate 2-reductase n=1 Tax=Sporosarcina koreensis TaxID=334735 RepID=A0ABW0U2D4_9BACL
MNITVIGAGAIGGVIGAYLVKGGYNVTFIDKNEDHVHAMNENGLTIIEKVQQFTVKVKAFTVDQFLETRETLETVFLAVKAQHTVEAIESVKDRLSDDSYVVSFQNGLCEEEIASVIGIEKTIGCFVNLFADYLEPGIVEYGGVGSVYLGELDGRESKRLAELIEVLSSWGDAKSTNNIQGFLWSKLAYGAVLTATATTNMEIADFFEDAVYYPLVTSIAIEVLQVANKKGIFTESFDGWTPNILYPEYQKEKVDAQFLELAKKLRGYTKTRTGIWRDLAVRKRKTEVPQQLNPVILEGEKLGLSLPLLTRLVEMINEIEEGKRPLQSENLEELELAFK